MTGSGSTTHESWDGIAPTLGYINVHVVYYNLNIGLVLLSGGYDIP